MKQQIKHSILSAAALMIIALPQSAFAAWKLNHQDSTIQFITTKNSSVAEPNQFKQLSGEIDDQGNISLKIDLASIDSKIELRDQRMKDDLFQVKEHPNATITSKISPEVLTKLQAGQSKTIAVDLNVSLHGHEQKIKTNVSITGLETGGLEFIIVEPIIVHAEQFGLDQGILALQKVAKLKSIAIAVPVTGRLVFKAN